MRRILSALGLMAVLAAAATSTAGAAKDWTNPRTLECDGGVVLETFLTPAGFGTPFHVEGSTAVFVPKIVTVNGSIVTRFTTGAISNAVDELTCRYTDPAGLEVEVIGVLT